MDGLINNLDQVKGKVGDNLRAALPHLELYQKLVTIDCTLALDQKVEDLVIQPSNDDELYEQFKDLGLHGLIKQFNIEPKQNLIRDGVDYQVVLSEKELTHLIDRISLADIVAVDTETTSLNYMEAQIVGISIAIEPNQAFYIPCMHDYDNAPKQLPRDYVLQQLKPWLEDSNTKKVGHNLKYDSHIFKNHNIDIQGVMFDTMLQSYVLNSTATRHNLNAVSKRYLNLNTVSYEDVAGKGAKEILFSQVDLKKATYYAAEDADISLQLYHKIYPQLEEHRSLLSIYNNIEAPALQVLQRVERNGVLIDKDLLGEQSEEFAITLKELENKVHSVAKTEFNLGSPKQLQEILFEKMGLPILRKTPKGQPSTAENVLQQLAYDYPIVKDILDYRTIAKLKTTYTDKLPLMINPRTGRVHTSYHQAVTATGRLSSSDPNLQNIPIRRAEGKRIREAFVVSEGYQMMAADYSQIELRIMAHISQDEGLLNAFSQGLDIHQATAAEIFNLSIEDVKQDHRRSAKAINFGLIYGMSAFGLSNQLSISRKEAEEYIRLYFSRYPKVKDYMDNTRLRTKETGYVETVLGRRLYLPDINASNYQRRQYAERSAINAPMQGTAADLIKMAMINLQKHIDNENLDAKIIMQVHDELVLEVRQDIVDSLKETINHIMSSVADLDVELKVDVGLGDNWQEAH
jgi:DNA polymerase-1